MAVRVASPFPVPHRRRLSEGVFKVALAMDSLSCERPVRRVFTPATIHLFLGFLS